MNSRTSSSEPQADLETETDQGDVSVSAGASAFAAALAEQMKDDDGDDDQQEEDSTDGVDGKPRESGKKVKLDSLESLAASLNIPVKDLYAVKVPASGGREAMTIGQIKDRFTSFDSLEADRLSLTEARVLQDAEFEQTRAELRELLAVVPKENLSQDALKAAAARVAARNKRDAANLLVALPEWQDEERRTAEVTDIANMLGKYGIPAVYVSTVRSPALLKFMRDAARREKQVQAALAVMKKAPKRKPVVETSGRTAPRIQTNGQPRNSLKPAPSAREQFSRKLSQLTGD